MVLQATSPLRGGACLREAVKLLNAHSDADSVVAMTECHLPPAQLFFANGEGYAIPVADDWRRPIYTPNGALYLARTEAIRRSNSLYAGRILPLVLHPICAIDIDTEQDLMLAEAMYKMGPPSESSSFAPRPARDASAR